MYENSYGYRVFWNFRLIFDIEVEKITVSDIEPKKITKIYKNETFDKDTRQINR